VDPYYTHRPHLTKILEQLDFTKTVRCVEFGSGDGSGEVFKQFTERYPNLKVVCLESDREWFNRTSVKYQSNNYRYKFVENWTNTIKSISPEEVFDLAFIDNGPTWDTRIQILEQIKNQCKHIIIHDYDYYNKGHMGLADGLNLEYYEAYRNTEHDIYSVGANSFFGKYAKNFILEAHSTELPPTLVLTNKTLI